MMGCNIGKPINAQMCIMCTYNCGQCLDTSNTTETLEMTLFVEIREHIVTAKIRRSHLPTILHSSSEGERLPYFEQSLQLANDGRVYLLYPTTVCHVIDAQSPLYDLSAKDLLEKR